MAERSPLILDSELVDMLATREEAVQIAIARRPFVSRAVSAALSEVGSADACMALLTNRGARVPRFSLDRIIERHGGCAELRCTLLERDDLPLEVRQVLLVAADGLAAQPGRRAASWLTCGARGDRDAGRLRARHHRRRLRGAGAEIPALVERLIAAKEMTPAFLIRAVASGQTLLFVAALAALAGVPQARVNALVCSGRTAGLRALLQKAGVPAATSPAFAAAIDVIRNGDPVSGALSDYRRATHLIDAIVTRYQTKPDRELDQILALLRRFATEAKRSAARGYAQQVMQAA